MIPRLQLLSMNDVQPIREQSAEQLRTILSNEPVSAKAQSDLSPQGAYVQPSVTRSVMEAFDSIKMPSQYGATDLSKL